MQDQEVAESARRIDADEANRMAQELNNQALGIDTPVHEIETENRTESEPVRGTPAVIEERGRSVFPPEIDADTTVGGDPESQAVLREEESR
jgi:hypothetical protein